MTAAAPAAVIERRGAIALITLNRPDVLNAVNSELSMAVGTALQEFNNDPDLRVAVITGAGRAFCAGADLRALAAGERIHAEGHDEWGFAGLVKHFVDKPVIAAVNGFALGGGTEILLACDLAVIAEDTKLGLPEVKRGLAAAAGGLLRLPRQIPLKLALEVALTGEPIDAATAARWGLVNRVAPADQVVEVALELARKIAANAPLAVHASKRVVHRASNFGSDWSDELWEMNADELRTVFRSEDAKEGPRAFAEKRAPRWQGR
ncbi:crotonase/enoyl-CoA hydratase family protein [Nocardia sp. ET3-3]|uniref:Probable enoyl-CoA hydratase EchA17 n=1 Tax=Nocardia terrae TaxID=2675851 RepID=A0A7K1V2I8_9NOCA|nr:crotonase/enoyl-CoA hydratase family protein [Nocardia terrae]MVU80712.1 crotonase/enoyl-CoA hydratase family protein [Nocardia terrae]